MSDQDLLPIASAAWLASRIDEPDVRLVDATVHMSDSGVRSGRDDWRSGHIPGTVFADLLGEFAVHDPYPMAIPPADVFAASVGGLGIGDDHTVVVYDNATNATNMWAARFWWMMRTYGADRVYVLDGGLRAWTEHGGAVCSVPCENPTATFSAREPSGTLVQRDEVASVFGNPEVMIVDALDAGHYRGERSDYGRAGHLPGAVNIPAEELVDPTTGRYLPVEQLRERFEDALASPRVITYCAAGVGAASDALVLAALGHDDVAVYDGSLLEWAADPTLPLASSSADG